MSPKGRVFLSYRRADSRYATRSIYDRLVLHFGEDSIFMDVNTIEAGLDFVEVLQSEVQSCDVLVAVIGQHWLNIEDGRGKRRLEDAEDFVRIEIAAALSRDIRVIPVLLDGVMMPPSTELPSELESFTRRNALRVEHDSFGSDVDRLIKQLELALPDVENTEESKAQALNALKRISLFGWLGIMLGLVTMLLALFFIFQPNIRSFGVAAGKDVIELGDTTKLEWNVSPFATRLSLSNMEQPINRGQVSQTVAPEQSTTYELTSGNWLSGMFDMDRTESQTVLVALSVPQIHVFEVDRTKISKGQLVRVSWSVSEADEVLLRIDKVVETLSEEEYSGEREIRLEKDALVTLEVKNASGSELQSSFVKVVPSYINVNIFRVWVRTVKYADMVYDPYTAIGYRVEFNPDVRDELQEGEQVMLEWDVDGVDNVLIEPFGSALPARGSQPFFVQESMDFVMTVQSGDLEGVYILPVKVSAGEP